MKRKKRSKRAVKSAQVAWVQGRGRYEGKPRHVRTDWAPSPDRVMVAIAALVPASHAVEGHAERMRAHMERVARDEVQPFDPRTERQCEACGHVAPRGVDSGWASRPLPPAEGGAQVFCRACFGRWGWGDAVTCSDDERGL